MASHVRTDVTEEQRPAAIFVAGQIVGLAMRLPVEAFVQASMSDELLLDYARRIELVAKPRRELDQQP